MFIFNKFFIKKNTMLKKINTNLVGAPSRSSYTQLQSVYILYISKERTSTMYVVTPHLIK